MLESFFPTQLLTKQRLVSIELHWTAHELSDARDANFGLSNRHNNHTAALQLHMVLTRILRPLHYLSVVRIGLNFTAHVIVEARVANVFSSHRLNDPSVVLQLHAMLWCHIRQLHLLSLV